MAAKEVKAVAIACQGGGSHTAFTAGVLKRILREKEALHAKGYKIRGLSGTSGGAICALLAWYGLLNDDWQDSIKRLDAFWADNAATEPWDLALNNWTLWTARLRDFLTVPELSPYFYPPWTEARLRAMVEAHVDFEKIPYLIRAESPVLLVGAVNVLSGEFKVFKDKDVTLDAILASAAIPNLFRAAHVDEMPYWDGLFSQNPPLREFVDGVEPAVKPDEIWLIQINPLKRGTEPKLIGEILDRRNELAGNLSLQQEMYFIRKVNEWIGSGVIQNPKYKPLEVRVIALGEELTVASKLDRSPGFIQTMMTVGEQKADEFLGALVHKSRPATALTNRLH
jgi:NTE family protein